MVDQDRALMNLRITGGVGRHAGDAGVSGLQHGDAEGLMVGTRKGDIDLGEEAPIRDLGRKPGYELHVAQPLEPRLGVCIAVFQPLRDPEWFIPVLFPADEERHVSVLGRQALDDLQRSLEVFVGAPAVLPQDGQLRPPSSVPALTEVNALKVNAEEANLELVAIDPLLQKTFSKHARGDVPLEVGHEPRYGLEKAALMLILLPVPAGEVVRIDGPEHGWCAKEVFPLEHERVGAPVRGVDHHVGRELLELPIKGRIQPVAPNFKAAFA